MDISFGGDSKDRWRYLRMRRNAKGEWDHCAGETPDSQRGRVTARVELQNNVKQAGFKIGFSSNNAK